METTGIEAPACIEFTDVLTPFNNLGRERVESAICSLRLPISLHILDAQSVMLAVVCALLMASSARSAAGLLIMTGGPINGLAHALYCE